MKKVMCLVLSCVMLASLFGCGQTASPSSDETKEAISTSAVEVKKSEKTVDVDLTKLSSTMVYSEVYNMTSNPDDYRGKLVRMNGNFAIYQDDATGKIYFACVIADATACCQQGLEFVLKGERKYPDDYPELDSEITVSGTFDTYYEGDMMYYQLINAEIEA